MLLIEIPLCWIRDIRKLTPINILATVLIAFGLCSVLFIALFNKNGPIDANGDEMTLVEEISHLPRIQDTWALFIGTSVSVYIIFSFDSPKHFTKTKVQLVSLFLQQKYLSSK